MKNQGVTVSTPVEAVDPGAGFTIKTINRTTLKHMSNWPGVVPLSDGIQVQPTKGKLHGYVTISISYPATLPKGITPEEVLITGYNPVFNSWIPVPAELDKKNHVLKVVTKTLSLPVARKVNTALSGFILGPVLSTAETSEEPITLSEEGMNPEVKNGLAELAVDVAKDAIEHHGHVIKEWTDKMWPTPPPLTCDPTKSTTQMLFQIEDPLSLFGDQLCTQKASDGKIEVQLVNVHDYPVNVHLPSSGVSWKTEDEDWDLNRALLDIESSIVSDHSFILREDRKATLEIDVSRLPPHSQISMNVFLPTVISDLQIWSIALYVNQLNEDYKDVKEWYHHFEDIQKFLNSYWNCLISPSISFLKHNNLDEQSSTQLIKDVNHNCSRLLADAVKLIWDKGWDIATNAVKSFFDIELTGGETAAPEITLIISIISQIWENPHVLREFILGLKAAKAREDGIQSLITLTANPLADVDWTKVITDMDCSDLGQGLQVDALQFGDVTGNGKAEAFVAVSCKPINDSWPDYFEVFDGASDPVHPRHMATLLEYHDSPPEVFHDSGLYIQSNQDITISGRTVTIQSAAGYHVGGPFLTVTDMFTWDGSRFVRGPRSVSQPT